jgi:hypothetical protein
MFSQESSSRQFPKTVLQEECPHLDHRLALSRLNEVHHGVQSHHKQQCASQVASRVVTSASSLTAQRQYRSSQQHSCQGVFEEFQVLQKRVLSCRRGKTVLSFLLQSLSSFFCAQAVAAGWVCLVDCNGKALCLLCGVTEGTESYVYTVNQYTAEASDNAVQLV